MLPPRKKEPTNFGTGLVLLWYIIISHFSVQCAIALSHICHICHIDFPTNLKDLNFFYKNRPHIRPHNRPQTRPLLFLVIGQK